MQNEQNQPIENIAIHDIIVINKHCRTGEDGNKKGYSFYEQGQIGIVTQVDQNRLVMKNPDMEEYVYDTNKVETDYYYTIGKGSEFQYMKEIDDTLGKELKKKAETEEYIKQIMTWRHDFEHTISFFGRLVRFMKSFK